MGTMWIIVFKKDSSIERIWMSLDQVKAKSLEEDVTLLYREMTMQTAKIIDDAVVWVDIKESRVER